jgi:hypothetical protein
LKRAEEWRREKAIVVGDEGEREKEGKRSSVFFDAEGKEEGKDRDKDVVDKDLDKMAKEEEGVWKT